MESRGAGRGGEERLSTHFAKFCSAGRSSTAAEARGSRRSEAEATRAKGEGRPTEEGADSWTEGASAAAGTAARASTAGRESEPWRARNDDAVRNGKGEEEVRRGRARADGAEHTGALRSSDHWARRMVRLHGVSVREQNAVFETTEQVGNLVEISTHVYSVMYDHNR